MKRILKFFAIGVPIFLTFVSLSSLIDGIFTWFDFFHDFIDVYGKFVREPIAWIVNLAWPDEWPEIPRWMFDVLVIWAACFTSLQLARSELRKMTEVKASMRGYIFAFLFGPFLLALCYFLERSPHYTSDGSPFHTIARYYLGMTLGFILVLFLNWQLVQECKDPSPSVKRIGVCEWRLLSSETRESLGLEV